MITNNEQQKKERITSQKKIVFDYLKRARCHPSADEIYKAVRKKLPRISKGTVYRILNNLKEKGEIKEFFFDVSRYESELSVHAHFICKSCRKIFDIFDLCGDFDCLLKNKKSEVGEITNYQICLYGLCKDCKKKRSKKKKT